jgi:hypothetical protein
VGDGDADHLAICCGDLLARVVDGMSACPACEYFGSTVTMTRRLMGGWVKRWRRCNMEDCGHKWQTYEIPIDALDISIPPEDLKELPVRNKEATNET